LNLEDLERTLSAKLDALGPAVRAALLRVLMLPDYERIGTIGTYWRGEPRTFAELINRLRRESAHTSGHDRRAAGG